MLFRRPFNSYILLEMPMIVGFGYFKIPKLMVLGCVPHESIGSVVI